MNSDGEIDPAMLTIIFKTGETQNKDGRNYKSKRKNAKLDSKELCSQTDNEYKKLCSQVANNARRGSWFAGKSLETLERKHVKKPWRQGFFAWYDGHVVHLRCESSVGTR